MMRDLHQSGSGRGYALGRDVLSARRAPDEIGASVTYYAAPPSVKVDGLTRGQATALWAGTAGLLALITRRFMRR